MISAISVRSPYLAAMGAPAKPAPTGAAPAAPQDSVCIAAAAPDKAAPTTTWKAVGLVGLMAVPIMAGALTMAHADQIVAPPATSISCVAAQSEAPPEDSPLTASFTQMQSISNPRSVDNATAREVRSGYARHIQAAQQHADAFASTASSLQQRGATLDNFAVFEDGTYGQDGCSVTVTKDASGTTVRMEDGDTVTTLRQTDGFRTVTLREGDRVSTLQETATQRQVITGNVTRNLFLKDVAGHQAGDFEVIINSARGGIAPGAVQRAEHIVVRGASVTDEVRQTISGFAGNIDIRTMDRYEVPQLSIEVTPRSQMRETYNMQQVDALTGQRSTSSRTVEIRQDGSTHVRTSINGAVKDYVEPHGDQPQPQ